MITPYLRKLAVQILLANPGGLSKVRFAKTIYFVHKGLVMAGVSKSIDLAFVRMPLGPVPVGFMNLTADSAILAKSRSTGLSYDAVEYRLVQQHDPDSEFPAIKRVSDSLAKYSTSQLVEVSHREPSWLNRVNGQEYIIEDADLALPLPKNLRRQSETLDNQFLQAKLLEGMLPDIVAESTSLEYPD